jgi:hypothetical protein
VPRREAFDRYLAEHDGEGETRRAEDRPTHLEGEDEGERREQARLVSCDARGIDARESRHQREPRVPHRERVAGVKAAVRELAHVVQRERAERVELPHPSEMEERVAGERALDEPKADAEPEAADHEDAAHETRRAWQPDLPRVAARDRPDEGERAGREQEGERHVERPADGKGQRQPGAHERDGRCEGRGGAPLAEAARDEHARQDHDQCPGGEPHP